MKKYFLFILCCMTFLAFFPLKVFAYEKIVSLEENKTWTGEIQVGQYFYFTPKETGFYTIDSVADNEDISSIHYSVTCNGNSLEDISTNSNITDAYFVENNKYLIEVGLYSFDKESDYEYDEQYGGTSNVSITIKKSSKSIKQLKVNQEIEAESDVDEENCFMVCPNVTGTYTLEFDTEEYYELYEIGKWGIEKHLQGTLNEFSNNMYKINLEASKKYLIIVGPTYGRPIAISVNKDNKDIVGLKMLDYNYHNPWDENDHVIHSGYAYESNTYSYFPTIDFRNACMTFEICYSDGTSSKHSVEEIGEDDFSVSYQLNVRYSGESVDLLESEHIKAGLQSIEVTILGNITTSYNINVDKKVDVNFPQIKIDEKITETIGRSTPKFYAFTPSENGYYTLWYKNDYDLMWNIFKKGMYCVYDAQDNEVDYIKNKGFKLKAGEKYVFFMSLGTDVTNYRGEDFTYWLGVNDEHKHIFSDWEIVKKETEEETGLKKRTCEDCGYEEVIITDKLEMKKENTSPAIKNDRNNVMSFENNSKVNSSGIIKSNGNKPNQIIIKKIRNLKKKRIVVKWKKDAKAKGYEIQYGTSKKFAKAKKLYRKSCSANIKKIKKKKTYYFRIRGYNILNGKKIYGKWSKSKKIKISK